MKINWPLFLKRIFILIFILLFFLHKITTQAYYNIYKYKYNINMKSKYIVAIKVLFILELSEEGSQCLENVLKKKYKSRTIKSQLQKYDVISGR